MPPPFISSLLLYSILFLTVYCLFTDADVDLDSSQQQAPAADYAPPPPSTNFIASNNPNLDFSTNAYDDGSASTGPLLLSSDECDNIQDSGGQKKRKKKRQLRNCPNPYLKTPNSPANSVKTREGAADDDENSWTQRGGNGQASPMAIPGLLLQTKPQPNLSLCPDVERPIPVCGRDDSKIPMGDSWLIQKCRPCK